MAITVIYAIVRYLIASNLYFRQNTAIPIDSANDIIAFYDIIANDIVTWFWHYNIHIAMDCYSFIANEITRANSRICFNESLWTY